MDLSTARHIRTPISGNHGSDSPANSQINHRKRHRYHTIVTCYRLIYGNIAKNIGAL